MNKFSDESKIYYVCFLLHLCSSELLFELDLLLDPVRVWRFKNAKSLGLDVISRSEYFSVCMNLFP